VKELLLGVTARKVSIFALLPLATLLAADTRTHPAPGTSIIHFGQVDAGVYKGSKPKTDADFRYLQSLHIQYIVNLQFLPFLSEAEEKKARKYGIKFIDRTINASPVAPSEKHIDVVLATLRDKRYHPVYFHCSLGRDRTSLITALYQNYYLGVSRENAWRGMLASGFKNSWSLRGLKVYFEKHSRAALCATSFLLLLR
jgi:protein-tyrosine phosphatase